AVAAEVHSTSSAAVSDRAVQGVSLPAGRAGCMIRPEQLLVHVAEAGSLVVESSLFQGVVSEVILRHQPTGRTRRVYHRPAGPALQPGMRVLLRVVACVLALLMPFALAGCDASAAAD